MVAVVIVAVLAVALASLIAYLVGRRAGADPLRSQLTDAESQVQELKISEARLQARLEGAAVEAERLERSEAQLKAALALAEQERTRSDHELREIGLAASRVPELEQQLAQLAVARDELAAARTRIAELTPVADELELRNQFIETLQRELTYRDERALALERRVDQLGAVVEAIEMARASLSSGRRSVAAGEEPGTRSDSMQQWEGEPSDPPTSAASFRGGQGGGPAHHIDLDEDDPDRPPAPIGRALEQALNGLGVTSFADLGIFEHGESSEPEH